MGLTNKKISENCKIILTIPADKKNYGGEPIFFAISVISLRIQRILPASQSYPYVKGYLSFIIPIVTINKDETTPNFKTATTIGFPVGVNIYYSDRFAFSYEITPSIVAQKSDGKPGTSKTSNVLFDPGPMFRFKNGFNIITRLAFETAGCYGFTPVFNKVYLQTKAVNYFVALSLPARFGNSQPASIGANVQFGFTFN
jgi:hypothetical protein